MFYTVIYANEEQQQKLLEKHLKHKPRVSYLKKLFGKEGTSIVSRSFSYNDEDGIGFVSLQLATGKSCSYQLRGDEPCFVEFTGFEGNIRYDVNYPKGEIHSILKSEGILAKDHFWKGGEI